MKSGCTFHKDVLSQDPNYKLLIKQEDFVRRLKAKSSLLLPATDLGYSFDKMLRFKDITFSSGGTFKLCFCDSSLLDGRQCQTERDYAVQVGTIHASGVSCLISNPLLQRVSCAPQFWGDTLRCYSHLAQAPMPKPPPILTSKAEILKDVEAESLETFCLFKPEEEICSYM